MGPAGRRVPVHGEHLGVQKGGDVRVVSGAACREQGGGCGAVERECHVPRLHAPVRSKLMSSGDPMTAMSAIWQQQRQHGSGAEETLHRDEASRGHSPASALGRGIWGGLSTGP